MSRPFDFESFFKGFGMKPEQLTCSHILSSQMPDGVYFCPSCKAKSQNPLKQNAPARPGA